MKVPTPEQLHALKVQLNLTGSEMAALVGYQPSVKTAMGLMIPDPNKWRKLTIPSSNKQSRGMSYAAFFHLAAQLALSDEEIQKITDKMAEILAS